MPTSILDVTPIQRLQILAIQAAHAQREDAENEAMAEGRSFF